MMRHVFFCMGMRWKRVEEDNELKIFFCVLFSFKQEGASDLIIVHFEWIFPFRERTCTKALLKVKFVNTILCIINFILVWFQSVVARQIFGVLCILIICIGYTTYIEEKHEIAVFRMGVLCCTTTVIFIAAPLATLMHVIKTKSTESLPFPMILSSCFVSLQWWLYGIILNDIFVQLPNFLGFALSIFQLGIFLCYPSTPTKTAGYNLVSHQF